ncbi:aminoacyl-tRNA deacylase [Cellulosimicrobium cellulans]|uniref:aminoacyl-tRNA deacylase n=1 Tax=Cellulosimicrobium cellulans TaxID=1710 RepID=UPI002405600B|nr:YbaK/EbsC family protein [Cellulosimicrobium cellulans]MDF9878479.1 Cys-tRNA(Pro)/Cys-tRNA(Cys) deacylase [Cellulosimicrobium cellulans]
MSSERALAALEASGIDYTVTRHGRVGSLEEAAAARGVDPARVLKTIVVRRAEDDYLFVLVPGDRQISWPKLRALLGVSRLSMPDKEVARDVTGYERGTITPFGSTHAWPVVADVRVVAGPGASDEVDVAGDEGAEPDVAARLVSIGGGAHGVAATVDGRALVGALGAQVADVTEPL